MDEREITLAEAERRLAETRGELERVDSELELMEAQSDIKPVDFTDAGNAAIFVNLYKEEAIFVRAIGWLVWDGKKFEANDFEATKLAIKMSDKMLSNALSDLSEARHELTLAETSRNQIVIAQAKANEVNAKAYHKHALSTREAPRINRMLELAKAYLHKELEELDADAFILNTPGGMIDLRTGNINPHDPRKLCTKMTSYNPGTKGSNMWEEFLKLITNDDSEIEDFLQQVAGMACIGKVYQESLIIAHGAGRNGKSTLFNSLAAVLDDYAGTIDPDVLCTSNRNKSYDLAELKGQRLVLAAELEEGKRLSTSILKRLASTDRISAERKYRDPESFTPSHSLILFTNYTPSVGSTDKGTWRRLILIPFKAKISDNSDIKNYAETLVNEAGEAMLGWILEGAKKFCANGYALKIPNVIKEATADYRNNNDWLTNFIKENCEEDINCRVSRRDLYSCYSNWCELNNEYIRNNKDFFAELENRDYETYVSHGYKGIKGLSLRLEQAEKTPFD